MDKIQNRRQFIRNAGYMTLGVALLGCGAAEESTTSTSENNTGNNTTSEAPIWSRIPTQSWIVGVPVFIDLADYVTDPEGDALAISLDKALPNGVTLNGSIISGTPTAVTQSATYMATADDGDL